MTYAINFSCLLYDLFPVTYILFALQEVKCLRLLKKFSPDTFMLKGHGGGDDDLDTEQQFKPVKRGQITDQLLELPIEQQIYDMIDAEGSKGLTINEVCHLYWLYLLAISFAFFFNLTLCIFCHPFVHYL